MSNLNFKFFFVCFWFTSALPLPPKNKSFLRDHNGNKATQFFVLSLPSHLVYIYIYAPSLVLVEHSVGSNTNNAWTPPLAVHSRHVATKPLWWWGGWAHWIVFMTSLYMYIYVYIYIYTHIIFVIYISYILYIANVIHKV